MPSSVLERIGKIGNTRFIKLDEHINLDVEFIGEGVYSQLYKSRSMDRRYVTVQLCPEIRAPPVIRVSSLAPSHISSSLTMK